jgi:predicted DsbA family dithiol-disulfide isomerase
MQNCERLLKATKEAVENKEVDAEIEYITDIEIIMSYGIMSTPALVIDEKVVATGRVLNIEKMI